MRRPARNLLLAAVAALATAAASTLVLAAPARAAGPTATFVKTADWGTGWEGKYTITNGGTGTINGWQVAFSLPAGTTLGSYWDATVTSAGQRHTFTNRSWNGTIAPGASVSFGFLATGAGSPTDCTLNGAPCGGGGPTSPPTTTPPTSTPPTTPPPTTPPPTTPPPTTPPPGGLPKHALIGYLHASFANGSGYLRMADVPADWDIINLAFGEPTSVTSGDIRFQLCPAAECPGVETEAEFIAAIRAKQQQGKKVLLSIGGQNGQVQLTTTAARDTFVRSVSAIIDRYGLNGLDIDFEGHSLYLNAGDTDFRNPTTPVIVNLISAIRALKQRYGANFVLTMAPETFFVQLGYQFYGPGPWGGQDPRAGSYLPVIHALRDDLTVLHVQDYNSGPIVGLDNQYHTMGGADFHIAMTDMLLAGFSVAGNANAVFPPLREDQVAFGAPSSVSAGNGYVAPAGVQAAVSCLVRGQSCGSYTPRSGTNPNFRGLMTWSINWDRYYNWEFRLNHGPFLKALP
ncbi:glycosyl hydrolase family 18 protein [Micromonospora sp. C28SCA-DRY-2]|uniref:chitinase n=1 Tax=Micromonospora sp. C28SCA-DRY-2 TaxID=3059522 RepID=UPI00267692F8|nr:cellulose binding domain-containing protein [Micromonospora sp. C28SCA-DRY-2]MDO3702877.1 glycosyl hydrolase family 18 protein [Micromonospora sp. C28SCA-DRY-2]